VSRPGLSTIPNLGGLISPTEWYGVAVGKNGLQDVYEDPMEAIAVVEGVMNPICKTFGPEAAAGRWARVYHKCVRERQFLWKQVRTRKGKLRGLSMDPMMMRHSFELFLCYQHAFGFRIQDLCATYIYLRARKVGCRTAYQTPETSEWWQRREEIQSAPKGGLTLHGNYQRPGPYGRTKYILDWRRTRMVVLKTISLAESLA
jgi:hypothetical protein